jgi:hypothetical protein
MGQMCDTPSVIVAATVFEQYLAIYFRSLNKIIASLNCIINIVRFEFQIQTLFFQTKSFLALAW